MSTAQRLTPTPVSPGRFTAAVPDGWQQGRGAYGGLVTALLTRALEATTPGRPLRSLTSELCGPVQPGEVTLEVEVLRAGNAVTTNAVRLTQGGEVLAHGVGVLGLARAGTARQVGLVAPERPDWRELEVVPVQPPYGPVFARHFEYRPARYLPYSGNTEPRAEGWIRPPPVDGTRDAAWLAFCIDAWWPALYAVAEAPRPMATVAFTFQPFAHLEGLDPAQPLFHRAQLAASDDGYCVELRELWGHDGRLLALNQQTFVIIK